MNKTIGIIIAAIVIIGGAYFLMNRAPATDTSSNQSDTSTTQNNENTNTPTVKPVNKVSAASGHVVFSVADAAADMQTIEEINMKVNKVEMHSTASGWVTVSSTPKTYDLLKLNTTNKSELLVDAGVKSGTYDQVRLNIASISIMTKSGATREAKLPSSVLKINTKVVMSASKITSVNLDFLADKSLHTTASGEFIFAPVVKIDSRSGAGVNIGDDNTVEIVGGTSDNASVVGMDIDGTVKLNFQISADQTLILDSNGKIKIQGVLQ